MYGIEIRGHSKAEVSLVPTFGIEWGDFWYREMDIRFNPAADSWNWIRFPARRPNYSPGYWKVRFDILGLSDRSAAMNHDRLIVVPLYFPTLLSALLLLLIWRMTRPRNIGKGFPIEPSVKVK